MLHLLDAFYYLTGWLILAGGAMLALLLVAPFLARRQRARRVHRQAVRQVRMVDVLINGTLDDPGSGYCRALIPVYLPVADRGAPAVPAAPERPAGTTVYRISSSTLAAAYRYLVQHGSGAANAEPEWMLAVTGIKLPNGERTLESLMEIRLQQQNQVRAAFNMADFTRVAVMLHEHGQALHAILHSHRFVGHPGPSGVDRALQRQLDAGGYPAIQAVFSEDGFVRFFGGTTPWAVEVHGRGALRLADDLYQITERSVLPAPVIREG